MYTVAYFKAKFEAIPEWLWFDKDYVNPENKAQMCALGHCGDRGILTQPQIEEARALSVLFTTNGMNVAMINDGNDPIYPQPTPKQRILAALADIEAANNNVESIKSIVECQLNLQHG